VLVVIGVVGAGVVGVVVVGTVACAGGKPGENGFPGP
jgi:hypothetical protein